MERNVINENPEYQRESAIWSKEKQQLFLDSIFHNIDIPKIYFHDVRNENGRYYYSIIDGKQRLYTIWRFFSDEIELADDFELRIRDPQSEDGSGELVLQGKTLYSEMNDHFRELFKSASLDIVLVQNADEEDIEELFSRLNNGEPLSAAEKRNAITGDMTTLIRQVAKHPVFSKKIRFATKRRQDYEAAVKIIIIEHTEMKGGEPYCDLKKRFLDQLVKDNKSMDTAQMEGLRKRVEIHLNFMKSIFDDEDPLLGKQAYVPLYYLFTKHISSNYGSPTLRSDIKSFLSDFQIMRKLNLEKEEEERDVSLIEFGRLMQQGTNDKNSLRERTQTLTRYFLGNYPNVEIKDRKRHFTPEERYAIYMLGGRQCDECGIGLQSLDEMHADHIEQHAFAGTTTISNARALCENCNTKLSKQVQ